MKRLVLCLALLASLSLWFGGCEEGSSSSTKVRFRNDSATRTVVAVWDGMRAATLAPGGISDYQITTSGRHTIQWKNTSGTALTSIGWPDLEDGHKYTFPYP